MDILRSSFWNPSLRFYADGGRFGNHIMIVDFTPLKLSALKIIRRNQKALELFKGL